MRKKKFELDTTHVFSDGSVMTQEELLTKRRVITRENNQEIFDDIMCILSPSYREQLIQKRRRESKEYRMKKIMEEEVRIKKAIAEADAN